MQPGDGSGIKQRDGSDAAFWGKMEQRDGSDASFWFLKQWDGSDGAAGRF